MSSTQLRPSERTRPLVAVVCAVPLLGEALVSALDFAEVRSFSERGGDVAGLLTWLRPDAIVVDSDGGAEGAADYARTSSTPLVHISVRERVMRLFADGEWRFVGNGDGPDGVRNVIAGALFARDVELS